MHQYTQYTAPCTGSADVQSVLEVWWEGLQELLKPFVGRRTPAAPPAQSELGAARCWARERFQLGSNTESSFILFDLVLNIAAVHPRFGCSHVLQVRLSWKNLCQHASWWQRAVGVLETWQTDWPVPLKMPPFRVLMIHWETIRGSLEQTKSSVLNQEVKHSHFRRNSWIEIRVWRKLNVKASRPREATESQSSKSWISVSIEPVSGASCLHSLQSLLSRIHQITHTHLLSSKPPMPPPPAT